MSERFATPTEELTEAHVSGRRLACLVCGAGAFARREVKMNTTGMSFLGLDWANRSAVAAVCRTCGYVHTFLGGDLEFRRPTGP
ncbi:zinc ribbon domain-containing protein [Nocardioides ferulae]|uniref:zinc ribbon domain-containing protein n=1 Tax=Nocardioides ferulae TaxID=2340821 RepID=UPI000EAFECE4|nr:zinc ribbon domain-containing protein [Nocardioides ferulae]